MAINYKRDDETLYHELELRAFDALMRENTSDPKTRMFILALRCS